MRGVGLKSLTGLRRVMVVIAFVSVAVNLLMLASPLYMLQVFDRVLSGRSVETLILLSVIVVFALAAMGGLDTCRALILARTGEWIEARLGGDVMTASINLSTTPSAQPTTQPVADLASVRQFIASPGAGALFDAPWMPLFILAIWLVHPWLGILALVSALVLTIFAILGDLTTRRTSPAVTATAARAQQLHEAIAGDGSLVRTMGLTSGLVARWQALQDANSRPVLAMTARLSVLSVWSKALRLGVQSAILGLGAYLVLNRQISPGEMIATSILLSRALAPVEVAIGSWRQFVQARMAWQRISRLLMAEATRPDGLALPDPVGSLQVEKVVVDIGGGRPAALRGVSFSLEAGDVLGVAGPSGSGKSTLAKLLAGAWMPTSGKVRLDNSDIAQWDRATFGRHVGYLPQQVDLFPGSIADNIARFGEADLEKVIAAATLASADAMIRSLPEGYQADAGFRGERLSGGQRQRVALARAIYGNPKVVVFDEPDTGLDQQGHNDLLNCVDRLRATGTTIVIVAHRKQTLSRCDKLLVLNGGLIEVFGATAKVQAHLQGLGSGPGASQALDGPK